MVCYYIKYLNRIITITTDEEGMAAKRLKNHILGELDGVSYDNITLRLVEENTVYSLDDNELVEYDQDFLLEITN